MFPQFASSLAQLFSGYSIYIYLGLSALNALLLFLISFKFLLVLQQSGYRRKPYLLWLNDKQTPYKSRLMLLCMLAFLFFCVLNASFAPAISDNGITSYIGFISYAVFLLLYFKSEKSVNAKIPLNKTRRLVRLSITYILICVLLTFALISAINILSFYLNKAPVSLLRYSLICFMPLFAPRLLSLANKINEPFENAIKKGYVRRAKAKLDSSDVVKIAITGSYGKTSVKEILAVILGQKFRVLSTPLSYNTPQGIALTVNKLDSTHDVFIAEMGARFKGDIKALTDLVNPDFAILTGVNNQHLETFKSIENVKATKNELFENLKKDGVAFFCSDNEIAKDLSNLYNGEKYLAGQSGDDNLVVATEVVLGSSGVTFTLNVKGEQPVKCTTVLLGRHNVSNICLASAVAYKMGMKPAEIAQGINRITSVGHRLELMPNNKGVVIIDDSYNSNVDGFKMAMEVIDKFEGRKIVLTPGLVELGKDENLYNYEMGKEMASHADKVIIIGTHNAEMLINGLVDGGFDRENILFSKSLSRGNETLNSIIREGDVVLFENDLPDNYN